MTTDNDQGIQNDTVNDASGADGSPEGQLAAMQAERDDMRDRMLRLAAEFENYKKRARKEQGDAESKGKEAILKDMLEVVDNLERAVSSWGDATDIKAVQQGVNLVLRLFQQKLERHDVKPLDAKGQPFDPRVHDAISQVPSADVPAGTVITEVMRGYRIGDRLLRPSAVIVSVAAPGGGGAQEGS